MAKRTPTDGPTPKRGRRGSDGEGEMKRVRQTAQSSSKGRPAPPPGAPSPPANATVASLDASRIDTIARFADAVWLLEPHGPEGDGFRDFAIVDMNGRAAQWSGLDRENAVGQLVSAAVPLLADSVIVAAADKAARSRTVVEVEAVLHPVGRPHLSLLCRIVPVGGLLAISVRDITALRRADTLRGEHLVVGSGKVVVFVLDPSDDLAIAFASANVRLFGVEACDLIDNGVKFASLVHPDDRESFYMEIAGFLRSGSDLFTQEFRVMGRLGGLRWVEAQTQVVHDANGKARQFQVVMLDITNRKAVERQLADKVQDLQMLGSVTESLSAMIELQPIFSYVKNVLPGLLSHLRIDAATLFLVNEAETGLAEEADFNGGPLWDFDGKRLQAAGFSISGLAMSERRPVVIEDCLATDIIPREWVERLGLRSCAAIPIVSHGQVVGVLRLEACRTQVHFSPALVDLFQTLANQFGPIIGNAKLFEKTRRAQLALRESEELFRRAIEQADAVAYQRRLGGDAFDFISAGIEKLTGYKPCELTANVWSSMVLETVPRSMPANGHRIRGDMGSWRADLRIRTKSGELRWLSDAGIGIPDGSGGDAVVLGILQDITERKTAEEEIRRLAATDFLTGIANRRSFMDTAQAEIERARRYERPVTLLMLDLDHFKRINDSCGHGAGDEVLVAVARCVESMLRISDVLGRLGGEEFGILLPETSMDAATDAAGRLKVAVEELGLPASAKGMMLTVSIGVAQLRPDGESLDEFLQRADHALYEAKRRGRNCFVVA